MAMLVRLSLVAILITTLAHDVAAQTPAAGSLPGTGWDAIELAGAAVPAQAAADRRPHLVFGADGRVSGSDGCNRLAGPYTLKDDEITFGPMLGTRMACPEQDAMAMRFQAALKGTGHWRIASGRLEFYGATGKPLAVFERRPVGAV